MLDLEETDVLEIESGLLLERNPSNIDSIPVENDVSYNEFFKKYLCRNSPCILQITAARNWKSVKEWTLDRKLEHAKTIARNKTGQNKTKDTQPVS